MRSISALLQALATLMRASCIHPTLVTPAYPSEFQLPIDSFFGPALYEEGLGTTARIRSRSYL